MKIVLKDNQETICLKFAEHTVGVGYDAVRDYTIISRNELLDINLNDVSIQKVKFFRFIMFQYLVI